MRDFDAVILEDSRVKVFCIVLSMTFCLFLWCHTLNEDEAYLHQSFRVYFLRFRQKSYFKIRYRPWMPGYGVWLWDIAKFVILYFFSIQMWTASGTMRSGYAYLSFMTEIAKSLCISVVNSRYRDIILTRSNTIPVISRFNGIVIRMYFLSSEHNSPIRIRRRLCFIKLKIFKSLMIIN